MKHSSHQILLCRQRLFSERNDWRSYQRRRWLGVSGEWMSLLDGGRHKEERVPHVWNLECELNWVRLALVSLHLLWSENWFCLLEMKKSCFFLCPLHFPCPSSHFVRHHSSAAIEEMREIILLWGMERRWERAREVVGVGGLKLQLHTVHASRAKTNSFWRHLPSFQLLGRCISFSCPIQITVNNYYQCRNI